MLAKPELPPTSQVSRLLHMIMFQHLGREKKQQLLFFLPVLQKDCKEYLKIEGTHKNQVQLTALAGLPRTKPCDMTKRVIQTLFGQAWCCDHFPWGACSSD